MATSALPQSTANPYARIAHPLHTVLLLVGELVLAYVGKIHSDQLRAAVTFNRISFYERGLLMEWLTLAFVILGVMLHGSSVRTVLGDRWRSLQQVLLDIGIAVAFLFAIVTFDSILASFLHPHHGTTEPAVRFLLPHGRLESLLWIAIAISAGICEEAVYRGYLQRQFTALTKNIPAGIILSAVFFGVAHSYQGLLLAAQIGLQGALAGILAQQRKTVRPGMIAHALQDILAIVVHH